MKKSGFAIIIVLLAIATLAFQPAFPSFAQASQVNLNIVSVNDDAFPIVELVFSVSDPQGFPIKDIEKASFSLSEDNQAIANYTVAPFMNTETPLSVALVVDTSGSMVRSLPDAVSAAQDFIATLGANDQVALIAFKEKADLVQELTADRDLINQALQGLTAVGDSAMFDSVIEAINTLKPRTERKVVVLITDGYETGISAFDFNQVVDEAVRWSTHIYPIGIGGVHKDNLDKLAKLTGGFAQVNPDSSALSDAFKNVLENLRNQYKLEYESSLMADGSEHSALVTYAYPEGSVSDDRRFIAKTGTITISFTDLADGQEISGDVLFSPGILAPARVSQLEVLVDDKLVTSVLSAPFECLWDSSLVEPGAHNFVINVTDEVGNNATKSLNLSVVPAVTITSNLAADQVLSGTITIPLEVKAARGIARVEFFVDNVKIAEDKESPYEIEWDTRSVIPGYHDLRFVATDLEQNIGENQLRVNVELQKANNLLWVAIIILLAALGVIIPFATRKNQSRKKAPVQPAAVPEQNPTLTERAGLEPGHVWKLSGGEIRLGRKRDENDIILKGTSASRFHAVINPTPNGYSIKTLNRENPVYINDQAVTDQVLLVSGDLIRAGESEFLYEA